MNSVINININIMKETYLIQFISFFFIDGSFIVLENMYKNFDQKSAITKEEIKNIVIKGSYTFKRDTKGKKCTVCTVSVTYAFDVLQDLGGDHALSIANLNLPVENVKCFMDEFVEQTDVAQDIINVSSNLIQIGHFEFREFEVTVKGIDEMKKLLRSYKEKLKEWYVHQWLQISLKTKNYFNNICLYR